MSSFPGIQGPYFGQFRRGPFQLQNTYEAVCFLPGKDKHWEVCYIFIFCLCPRLGIRFSTSEPGGSGYLPSSTKIGMCLHDSLWAMAKLLLGVCHNFGSLSHPIFCLNGEWLCPTSRYGATLKGEMQETKK